MDIKVDKSEKYNWSIVVGEEELRRLDETIKGAFINSKASELWYSIKCSDGSLLSTSDISEVVAEENSKNCKIERIFVRAENPKGSRIINVSLGNMYSGENTSYSISGDSRDWVYLTSSKIEERIRNLKEPYSLVPKVDSGFIYIFSILAVVKYLDTIKVYGLQAVLIVILFYLLMRVIIHACRYLFPSLVFRIGDGMKRHDAVLKLRGNVFWVIIVGSLISIVLSGVLFK